MKAIHYPNQHHSDYREVWYDEHGHERTAGLDPGLGLDISIVEVKTVLDLDAIEEYMRADFEANLPPCGPIQSGKAPKHRRAKDVTVPFVWRTHDGSEFLPANMASSHLFYAIRMMFNNYVPKQYRVGAFKAYPDIKSWDTEYLYAALFELTRELRDRDDLDEWQEDEFDRILENSKQLADQSFWYYRALGL